MKATGKKYFLLEAGPLSMLVPALLLFLFIQLTTPLLNSGDDAYLMYTLAGGFGEPPSSLLHYDHGWHYWLGSFTRQLFMLFPGINAYVIVLLFLQWAGLSAVLYVLLKKRKTGVALLLFFVLFLFVVSRLLLALSYTGTTFVAACGALTLLLHVVSEKKFIRFTSIAAFLLLLMAAMLRLHVTVLAICLFLPGLFFFARRILFPAGVIIFLFAGVLIMGLYALHQQHYTQEIPGWKKQEAYRQALFNMYNRPVDYKGIPATFSGKEEQDLFFASFLYDSSRFTAARLSEIGKKLSRKRLLNESEDREGLYWFFKECRIYLLLFLVYVLFLSANRDYKSLRRWLLSLSMVLAVYAALFVFLKMTATLHFGLLFFLFIQATLQPENSVRYANSKRFFTYLFAGILLLLSGWMGYRLYKDNKQNETRSTEFHCVLDEINQHPDQLFIATDDSFPLGYFSIRDLPRQYPVLNLIYKDRMLTHMYPQTLKRFGYASVDEAITTGKNVYLLGAPLPALENVYKGFTLTEKLPGFRCLEVRKLEHLP